MADEGEYDLFCTHCGQRINKDTVFCPSCGTQVSEMGGEPTYSNNYNYNNRPVIDRSPRLKALAILFTIIAVLFLALGAYYLANIDVIMDNLKADPQWPDIVKQIEDMGYTEQWFLDTIRQYLVIFSVMFIVAGVGAAIAAVCAFAKKCWAIGLIACIVVTITTSTTFIGLIIDMIYTYF